MNNHLKVDQIIGWKEGKWKWKKEMILTEYVIEMKMKMKFCDVLYNSRSVSINMTELKCKFKISINQVHTYKLRNETIISFEKNWRLVSELCIR